MNDTLFELVTDTFDGTSVGVPYVAPQAIVKLWENCNVANAAVTTANTAAAFYDSLGALAMGAPPNVVVADTANTNWESCVFAPQRERRKLVDQTLATPLEVKEGDSECVKCKQRKVIVHRQPVLRARTAPLTVSAGMLRHGTVIFFSAC